MPKTLTPPELDRREEELRDHDIHNGGRRPPKPPREKRTGGNGDGDNFNNQPQGSRGPRERISQVRTGLFFGLFAVVMVFIAIASAFFVAKTSYHVDAYSHVINSWLAIKLPNILWANTGVLVISSFTAELARRSMFRESELMEEWLGIGRRTSNRSALWLTATLVLGLVFIVGQIAAWLQLNAQLHITGPSARYFYLITMAHAAHLLLGVGALATAIVYLFRSKVLLTRQILVDATVWYWHAMGILWIALFALLEFCQ